MQRTAEIQVIGLTDVREAERAHLGAVFLTAALVSAYLLVWSTLSTRIDGVDAGVFSLVYRLPPTYWAGFGLLLVATITWYFGGGTRPYHFLLVALWMGYLFVGPELMEAYPRGVSSYAQSWGVQYVLEGREEEFFYFPWLGFHYAFAGLADLTDIGHPALIRIGLLVMYVALATGLVTLFGRALPDRKSALLATLISLAMIAVLGVGFTPHAMAFVLILIGFAFLVSLDANPVANRIALIGLFGAIVVTHGLSALVLVYVAAVAALVRWKRPATAGRRSPSSASLSLLFATIFVAWLMYSSDFWFPAAVESFRDTVLREPVAFTAPFSHVSPTREGAGRADVSLLNFAFLAVLMIWLLGLFATRRFWNNLSRERLFPLLVAAGMPLLVLGSGSFSFEGFTRVFLYAIPFLAWFLARESRARRSAVAFLVVLLGLGFVTLYAREFEELPTSQQFAGANFLAGAAGADERVIQGECLPLGAITHTVDAPYTACFSRQSDKPEPGPPDIRLHTFVVLSELGERTTSFAFGQAWWEDIRGMIEGGAFAKVYSNGAYDVFARQPP